MIDSAPRFYDWKTEQTHGVQNKMIMEIVLHIEKGFRSMMAYRFSMSPTTYIDYISIQDSYLKQFSHKSNPLLTELPWSPKFYEKLC